MTKPALDDDLHYLDAGIGDDLDALLVFNILRTNSHLAPLVDSDLKRVDLTAAQLNALLALRNAGEAGLLMGELGRRLVVTKSNVTGLVDRLEQQGLVARGQYHDRRATVVRLTGAGRELLQRAVPEHVRRLGELTGCLSPSQKRTLIQLLSTLRRELRRHRHGSGTLPEGAG